MLVLSKEYACLNPKCLFRFRVFADAESGYVLPQPRTCPRIVGTSGGGSKKCTSTSLREVEGSNEVQNKSRHIALL